MEAIITLEFLTNTMLVLSSVIGLFLAFIMGYKTVRNHMKYHVFRPLLAGFSAFLFESSLVNLYILSYWRGDINSAYMSHIFIAVFILIGYLILLTTVLYSARYIFEKMDATLLASKDDIIEGKEEEKCLQEM